MHEMGIAASILEAAHDELHRRAERRRVSKIGVRIGEFAGVDPESLRFCFEAQVKGTEWEPLELEIEWRRAGESLDSKRRSTGEELEVAFLELDEAGDGKSSEVAV